MVPLQGGTLIGYRLRSIIKVKFNEEEEEEGISEKCLQNSCDQILHSSHRFNHCSIEQKWKNSIRLTFLQHLNEIIVLVG